MGRAKEMMIERQREEFEKKLAGILGISYDELSEISFEIKNNESKDGLLYNYIIEFPDVSNPQILDKIKGLEDRKRVWLQPWELYEEEHYYDEQYDAILHNHQFYDRFEIEIQNLKKLNEIEISDSSLQEVFRRQVYIGIIGTLETFLSETFINLTANNEEYFKNFVKSHPDFRQRKFELREIFDQNEKLKDTAKKVMLDTIYHDLPKVREMYRATFEIDFPEINEVFNYILIRHDLVHRNGKTKENEKVLLSKVIVEELILKTKNFAEELATNLDLKNIEW
ncbi:MAG: hypothetical protein U5L09_04740 [Bacteroidales bacterium]|nr:hypothetical protein [Bacteroidales bacterium]